jgi:hypothetical protein
MTAPGQSLAKLVELLAGPPFVVTMILPLPLRESPLHQIDIA